MTPVFESISNEGLSLIANAVKDTPSAFCDFSPFVLYFWSDYNKTEYAFSDTNVLYSYKIRGGTCYSFQGDTEKSIDALFNTTSQDNIVLILISDSQLKEIENNNKYKILEKTANEDWMDYVYLGSDLSSFSGKRFSGQRNHTNKFIANNPDWTCEKITSSNVEEVKSFWKSLSENIENMDETALYEREKLFEFLDGFGKIKPLEKMTGALIRAKGEIVSFAFGEIIGDTLFVHVEKARRDVQGAYQMIVREFAKLNNAQFINREEDMGIEGLRISKNSYHPIRKEKKYRITLEKRT